MAEKLKKLSIEGFKSIEELIEFPLTDLNILIGANGAGKSNFVQFFTMLRKLVNQNLKEYIASNGTSGSFLFNGPKITNVLKAELCFGSNRYRFVLKPIVSEQFLIKEEEQLYDNSGWHSISSGVLESKLKDIKDEPGITGQKGIGHYVYESISNWFVYHFHDTGKLSPLRSSDIIDNNERLMENGDNIAPLLYHLQNNYKDEYRDIVETVRLVTPFFEDFQFRPAKTKDTELIKLTWKQKGSDYPFQPFHLSDGTLRFIALVTALLQPNSPRTIIIDEPELGLHPYAIDILAELIQAISGRNQIIISSQSSCLVSKFNPEDVIVVKREEGSSTFDRLSKNDLQEWLKVYSLGELWEKNVIEGGPARE